MNIKKSQLEEIIKQIVREALYKKVSPNATDTAKEDKARTIQHDPEVNEASYKTVKDNPSDPKNIEAKILSSGKSLPVCNSLNTKEIMVIRRTYPDIKVRAIAKEVLRWRNKEKEISRQQAKKAKEEKKEANHEAVDTGDSA